MYNGVSHSALLPADRSDVTFTPALLASSPAEPVMTGLVGHISPIVLVSPLSPPSLASLASFASFSLLDLHGTSYRTRVRFSCPASMATGTLHQ